MATRRPRRVNEADLDESLRELESLKVTPREPTHLGNFENHVAHAADRQARSADDEDDRRGREGVSEHPDEDQLDEGTLESEPDEVAAAGEEEGPEDAEDALDSDSPPESLGPASPAERRWERERSDMLARLENQDRELEFLRRAQVHGQPTQPQNPLAAVPLPFHVTEADLAELMQGGPNAVQLFNRALQLTATATAQHTAQVLANAYQEARANETGSETIVQAFYRENPDLTPYTEVVQAQANAVWAQLPHASAETKLAELSRRTRVRLKEWGFTDVQQRRSKPKRRAAGRAEDEQEGRRRRPAVAEMGSRGSRGNGASRMTRQEREMYELIP